MEEVTSKFTSFIYHALMVYNTPTSKQEGAPHVKVGDI